MALSAKEKSWQMFNDWCEARGLCPAPANPWTLSAYIRYLEASMPLVKLRRHIDQVGQMHFEKLRKRPDRHADVQQTLEGVKARKEAQKKKVEHVPPLFRDEDFLENGTNKPTKGRTKPSLNGKTKPKRALRVKPKLVRRKKV